MENFNNIDFNLYKNFLTVAKCGSISKASKKLMVSQPAVSHSIKELENQLNCNLFIRNAKGVELTADAERLIFYVENAFNMLGMGYKVLNDSSDFLKGEIKIGVPTHIGIFFLSNYIQMFNARYPGIRFYIVNKSTKEMVDLLERRNLDLIVDSYPIESKREDITITNLLEIDNCFVANAKYKEIIEPKRGINVEKIKKFQLLLPPKGTSTRDLLEKTLNGRIHNLEAQIDVPTTEVMLELVKRGLGIGYFCRNAIQQYIDSGELIEIPVDVQLPKTTICIAWIENYLMSAPKEFKNLIEKRVNELEMIKSKSLRLLLTSNCIYNCIMCHKEGIEGARQPKLNGEDIEFLFKSLNQEYGIKKVNISGGEPLLRKDIVEIVRRLKQCDAKVNLTTNGYLLDKYLELGALLNKINVSLHTTNQEKFNEITRTSGYYDKVINNLKELRTEHPTLNICISMTLMKGINSDYSEIERMINFASTIKANLKIIELYPSSSSDYVKLEKVESFLIDRKFILKKKSFRKKVFFNDEIEIILEKCTCTVVSEHADKENTCKMHNDIYITADAKISICRLNNFEVDIYEEISNRRKKELIKKVEDGISIMGNNCKC